MEGVVAGIHQQPSGISISVLVQQMTFHTLELQHTKHTLLTPDRPLMTNGRGQPDAHIVMPISPTRLFIVVREKRIIEQIAGTKNNKLIACVKSRLAEQAQRFVYGEACSQLRFVETRRGNKVPSTLFG
ncbi:hypothetical protein [Bradyrhizobium sp. JYMT SZCCT0428]|uniref:hypothetical protein n=1 Tax=Bradyrhizobium sp. JYMT SZCCT0428 TaxID=2807673 RepID=UPI001BA64D14|nr:hypothetical protein [Bradyrhizobium sp. JYMT SZCCT0428]MBR1157001.1 hypothetical protein [Bradyrhizobium sp. JYMT SZCCT0428]